MSASLDNEPNETKQGDGGSGVTLQYSQTDFSPKKKDEGPKREKNIKGMKSMKQQRPLHGHGPLPLAVPQCFKISTQRIHLSRTFRR